MEAAIKKAFQVWSGVSPLRFTKVSQGEADINIAFVQGGGLKAVTSILLSLTEVRLGNVLTQIVLFQLMATTLHLMGPMESLPMPSSQAQVLEEMLILMQKKHGPKPLKVR